MRLKPAKTPSWSNRSPCNISHVLKFAQNRGPLPCTAVSVFSKTTGERQLFAAVINIYVYITFFLSHVFTRVSTAQIFPGTPALYLTHLHNILRFSMLLRSTKDRGAAPAPARPKLYRLDRMAPAFCAAVRGLCKRPAVLCSLSRSPVPLSKSTARKKHPPPFPRQ